MSTQAELLQIHRNLAVMLIAANNAAEVMRICSTTSSGGNSIVTELSVAFNLREGEADMIANLRLKEFSPESIGQIRRDMEEVTRQLQAAAE